MDTFKYYLGVHMNYIAAEEHEPVYGRNNCMVKYCIISIFHSLPFKIIPKIVVRKLTTIATKCLKSFPVKGGLSLYYSPHVIMHGSPLDYENHCQIPFGAYAQVSN